MDNLVINIAKDFSESPGGRSKKVGEFSAEEFLEKYLQQIKDAILENKKVELELDGTEGYRSSFLEEVFGKLSLTLGKDKIKDDIIIGTRNKFLHDEISTYL